MDSISDTQELVGAFKIRVTRRRILCHLMAAAVGLLIISPLTLMLLDRGEVLVLESAAISPNPIRAGDRATVTWVARDLRSCDGQMWRTIVGPNNIVHKFAVEPTIYRDLIHGQPRQFSKTFEMPRSLYGTVENGEPRTANYYVETLRWCNWVQKIFWPMYDISNPVPFQVLPPAQPEQ